MVGAIIGGGFNGVDYDNGINVGLYKTEIPAISGSGSWTGGVYFIPESYKNNITDFKSYQPSTIDDLWYWTAPEDGVYYCRTHTSEGRGTHGIFVNDNFVTPVGDHYLSNTVATLILNKNDIVRILDLGNVVEYATSQKVKTLTEFIDMYPSLLSQQGYPQGPIFNTSRFFPFKNSDVSEYGYFGGMGFPDYSRGFDIRNTDGSITGWTAPEDGWLILGVRFSGHYGILLRANNLNGDNIRKTGGTFGHNYQIIPINKGDVLKYFHVQDPSHIDTNDQSTLLNLWHLNPPFTASTHVTKDNIKYGMFFPCKQKFDGNSFFVPDWENVKIYWNPSEGTTVDTSTICEYTKADAVKEYGGTEEEAWKIALKVERKIGEDADNNVCLPASGWISPDDGWVCVIGAGYRNWYSATNK